MLRASERGAMLFQLGDFTSHSGSVLPWKIRCDELSGDDWKCLARIAHDLIGAWGSVEGVLAGGVPFAAALAAHVTKGPVLIADDVLTTGASMEEQRAGRDAIGVVVFARAVCPSWVMPIFTLFDNEQRIAAGKPATEGRG